MWPCLLAWVLKAGSCMLCTRHTRIEPQLRRAGEEFAGFIGHDDPRDVFSFFALPGLLTGQVEVLTNW